MTTTPPHPLIALRTAKLLTQRQLAQLAKVADRTIVNIESRRMLPMQHTRRRILKALGLSISDAVGLFGPLPVRQGRPR